MSNFYSVKDKALFIHIPKTGGWGIKHTLLNRNALPSSAVALGSVPENWVYDFSFAFIRNPFDRFCSAFRMFKYGGLDCNEPVKEDLTIDRMIEILLDENIGYSSQSDSIESNIKHHTIPMTHPFNCISYAKTIYRFELYSDAYHDICNRLGRNTKIKHTNKSLNNDKHYSEIITAKQRLALEKIYKKDLEEFNYTFETAVKKPSDILLIGNGPSATEYEVGGIIDGFNGDIVRFNHAKVKGFESKLGSRTDIWAFCGNPPHDFRAGELGASAALMSYPSDFKSMHKDLWELYEREYGKEFDLLQMPWSEYNQVNEEVGHMPSSGALVANYFLNRGHRVQFYGFDHFSKHQHHYWKDRSVHGKSGHDPSKEREWFLNSVADSTISEFRPYEDTNYLVGQTKKNTKDMKKTVKGKHTESPSVIAPIVMAYFNPKSVVDYGCNIGVWLQAFKDLGAKEVHGYDVWERGENSCLTAGEFDQVNFEVDIPVKKSDLAINLENAEHVSEARADVLIDALTSSAPVVLFSAATPGQGGDHHLNEQPHEYWHYKFATRGYIMYDTIRWAVRGNPKVSWWYKNNIFLYVRSPYIKS